MSTRRRSWSDWEIDLIVADYFDMFQMKLAGEDFMKKHRNEALQKHLDNRSPGAIEYKHQNISAVLQELGRPWLSGYVPMKKFQKALADGVKRYLDRTEAFVHQDKQILARAAQSGPIEQCLPLEPAPTIEPSEPRASKQLRQKYDAATQDAENRELGRLGEEQILTSERIRLAEAGRKDLARKVEWTSQVVGDGEGYDILSYNAASGEERLLEVKTTFGGRRASFYLTENEYLTSIEHPDKYRLVRLYDFGPSPKMFILSPPLKEAAVLRPINYRVSFCV